MLYFKQFRHICRSRRCYLYFLAIFVTTLVLGYVAIANHILLDKYDEIHQKEPILNTELPRKEHVINEEHPNDLNTVHNTNSHINYKVHVFYYAWYANPEIDGEYRHWNHQYIPPWNKNDHHKYPTGHHYPPNDIGSNFYPALGCYSSNDVNVIEMHMKSLNEAGVGVVVLSWRPGNEIDSLGRILKVFFDTAHLYKLKITLHVEPYENRNPENLQKHLSAFLDDFGNHPALYKVKKQFGSKELPLIYIYDSYLTTARDWREFLNEKGKFTVRNTKNDGIFIGLLVDIQHREHIRDSDFDGFYTYFASNGFSYGSSWKNWKALGKFALDNNLIFIPSVGPGYIDTQVRPWNSEYTRHRKDGQYYNTAWREALESHVKYVSLTSFNEWHEGTQIEPAIVKSFMNFVYLDYEPEGMNFYMNITKKWALEFK